MHWKILAGLRFILSCIVLSCHLTYFVSSTNPLVFPAKLGGLTAVLGFFLISGYSIANSIKRNPKGFYQRRIFRIYPLYICAIIFSLVPFLILGKNIHLLGSAEFIQPTVKEVIGNLLFLQGFKIQRLSSDPVVWTLSIEVLCYLLAPLFAKIGNKALLIIIALSSLLYASFPYLHLSYYSDLQYGLGFFMLLWAWLLGFFYFYNQEKTYSRFLLVGLGCLLILVNNLYIDQLGIFVYIFSSLVLIYSPQLKLSKKLLSISNYLGNISYPLYLLHIPSLIVSYSILNIRNPILLVCSSLLASMFFYHVIEVPIHSKKLQK